MMMMLMETDDKDGWRANKDVEEEEGEEEGEEEESRMRTFTTIVEQRKRFESKRSSPNVESTRDQRLRQK
jgi:hypothetical protein